MGFASVSCGTTDVFEEQTLPLAYGIISVAFCQINEVIVGRLRCKC